MGLQRGWIGTVRERQRFSPPAVGTLSWREHLEAAGLSKSSPDTRVKFALFARPDVGHPESSAQLKGFHDIFMGSGGPIEVIKEQIFVLWT